MNSLMLDFANAGNNLSLFLPLSSPLFYFLFPKYYFVIVPSFFFPFETLYCTNYFLINLVVPIPLWNPWGSTENLLSGGDVEDP